MENIRLGLAQGITAEAVVRRLKAGEKLFILDVRETDEVEASPLPFERTKVIALGELRDRWQEVPTNSLTVTVCGLGIRGYEAACILRGIYVRQVSFLPGGTSVVNAYYI